MLVKASFDFIRISIHAGKAAIDSFIKTRPIHFACTAAHTDSIQMMFTIHIHKVIENLSTPIMCKKKSTQRQHTKENELRRDLKTNSENMDESN